MTDLLSAGGIFAACWLMYAALYLFLAGIGVVRDAEGLIVVLAFMSAMVVFVLSVAFLGGRFSSHGAHLVASVGAPFAFLGFAATFLLLGPVSVQRSVSFTMLLALDRGEPVPEQRVFDFRWRQLEAGGLIDADRQLTPRGRRTIRFALWLGRLLNATPQ